ncbi:MAG: peptide-methionine (S)-S-oxide reductase MsrA [Novosphingobium sp.]|nr:peptide-methionine (S)-S-oxide reductase MsrA [Novosphingobium sp.]
MRLSALVLAFAALAACQQTSTAAPSASVRERVTLAPVAVRQANEGKALQTAIFAGGCFWGIEGVFSHVRGVTSAVSGYHGGSRANATYDRVSRGDTGHAEAVRVVYDPAKVRYDQLLRVFFSVGADPTLRNRQGPDVGTQYRAALVPLTPEQRAVAAAYLAQLGASGLWRAPIATRIEAYQRFYPAEADHQDFMRAHPDHPYILRWDAPKVAALRRLFPTIYQAGFIIR